MMAEIDLDDDMDLELGDAMTDVSSADFEENLEGDLRFFRHMIHPHTRLSPSQHACFASGRYINQNLEMFCLPHPLVIAKKTSISENMMVRRLPQSAYTDIRTSFLCVLNLASPFVLTGHANS